MKDDSVADDLETDIFKDKSDGAVSLAVQEDAAYKSVFLRFGFV